MTAAMRQWLRGVPSASAEEVAIYRAAHQVLDAPLIFVDPLALSVIGREAREALTAQPPRLRIDAQIRAFIALRSHVAEHELASAVRAGVAQYVIVGAGLDTFAYRNPYAGRVRVFEVDQPAMQKWKRGRLADAGITTPESVAFVALDLRGQTLAAALSAAGFLAERPAFFAMLGVVIYLAKPTLMSILTFVASLPGRSGIVFDYGVPDLSLSANQRAVREAAAQVAANAGEPFVTFLDPSELAQEARRLGFNEVDDFGYAEGNLRYFNAREDGLRLGASGRRIVALRR
jgi:methyltransferase (TIGR00027 family)